MITLHFNIIHNGGNMPYNITDEKKQQIINANDIVDVIEEFLPLKRKGTNYLACCPFHKEKTPSFVVSKEKQIYHCFGCGVSGDVIKFLMEYKNLSFIEALEYLANRVNITIKEYNVTQKEVKEKDELANKVFKINKEAAFYFHKLLLNNNKPLLYLKKRYIDESIIKKFGIGYTVREWDKLLVYLKKKGYTESDMIKAGLIIKRKDNNGYFDRFRDRIIFPIIDTKRRVIGFGGRVMDDSQPKYMNSPESIVFKKGYNLYGLNIAKENIKDNPFYLVEGYMDVIKMHSYGFNTAVAALGTSLTNNQISLLKRYSNDFYICFDSDNAGLTAALRAVNMFKRCNLDAKVIIIENAKDPDEFLNKFGEIKFKMLKEKALNYYDFLDFYYRYNIDKNSFNKVDYINKFFNNLVNVNSEIERELIIEKLSAKVKVSKDSLLSEYRKKYCRNSNNSSKNNTFPNKNKVVNKEKYKTLTVIKNNFKNSHEEELLKLVLLNNKLAFEFEQIIFDDDFKSYIYLDVFKEIYDLVKNEFDLKDNIVEILIKYNINIDNIVSNSQELTESKINILFYDCFKRLRIKYLEILRKNKNQQLTKLNDYTIQINNMKEITRLAKKIKSLKEEVS